jgi:hypothetical protein
VVATAREAGVTRRRLSVAPVLLVISGVLFVTEAAVYVRFALSRPALEHHAAASARSGPSDRVVRVGLFVVRETDVQPGGVVRMITAECMFDDCGLAFSSGGAPPVVGEDAYYSLTDNWWLWHRSW